ncbi:MAG: hypothetical protein AAB372_01390 [Patescibacteria group bacterium]
MKSKNKEYELSQVKTSFIAFLESYNKSIPTSFPQASERVLQEFKKAHPSLFKSGNDEQWSIEVHRKRLMDWLSSNREIA